MHGSLISNIIPQNIVIRSLFKLSIAGVLLGLLKNYQWLLAIILLLKIAFDARRVKQKWVDTHFYLYLFGVLLTTVLGIIAEYWGTIYHFWDYHHLAEHQLIPLWLPFAWAYAYYFIYNTEKQILSMYPLKQNQRLLVMLLLSLIIPTYGEVIAIHLGVWTYRWPYQFFGVPLLAMLLLMILHSSVFLVLSWLAKHRSYIDVVYRPFNPESNVTLSIKCA